VSVEVKFDRLRIFLAASGEAKFVIVSRSLSGFRCVMLDVTLTVEKLSL
jgi:hypothetical protein